MGLASLRIFLLRYLPFSCTKNIPTCVTEKQVTQVKSPKGGRYKQLPGSMPVPVSPLAVTPNCSKRPLSEPLDTLDCVYVCVHTCACIYTSRYWWDAFSYVPKRCHLRVQQAELAWMSTNSRSHQPREGKDEGTPALKILPSAPYSVGGELKRGEFLLFTWSLPYSWQIGLSYNILKANNICKTIFEKFWLTCFQMNISFLDGQLGCPFCRASLDPRKSPTTAFWTGQSWKFLLVFPHPCICLFVW